MSNQPDFHPEVLTSYEDFSLIVDSDIFHYLRKHSVTEYENILRQNDVELLDVNCGDITTLYLQQKQAPFDRGMSSIIRAHQGLTRLYQEKESQLRKEQLSKCDIPTKDVNQVLESLRMRLPMLMMDEDKDSVYIVGSKSDVSEAKQFIADVREVRSDKQGQSDNLFGPSQPPFRSSKQKRALYEQTDIFQTSGNHLHDSDDLFKPERSRDDILNYNCSDKNKDIFSIRTHSGRPKEKHSISKLQTPKSGGSNDKHNGDLDEKCYSSTSEETRSKSSGRQKSVRGNKTKGSDSVLVSHKDLDTIPGDKRTKGSAGKRQDTLEDFGVFAIVDKHTDSVFTSHKDPEIKESNMRGFITEESQDIISVRRQDTLEIKSGGSDVVGTNTDSVQTSHKDLDEKKSAISRGFTSEETQDIFHVGRCDTSAEQTGGSVVDKSPDTLLVSQKDLDEKESSLQESCAKISDRQNSTRGNKTKPADSVRERKMAANFGGTRLSQDDTLFGSHFVSINEPVNKNPSSIISSSSAEMKSIKTSKGQDVTGRPYSSTHDDETSHHSVESQSFSLGHVTLGGDTGIKPGANTPALRRSSSFSGKIKPRQAEQVNPANVHLSPGQKGLNLETSRTQPLFSLDLIVPRQLWIYIKCIYITEVKDLTSDLEIGEMLEKGDITLHLKGADSEKVNKCHQRLKSLIARVKTDFDKRIIPLSVLGVTDCKDQILVKFCTEMKQRHYKVKIIVSSNCVNILGPKHPCDNVEATMMEVFQTGVRCTETETKSQKSNEADQPMRTPARPEPSKTSVLKTDPKNEKQIPLQSPNQDVNQNTKELFLREDLEEVKHLKQNNVRTFKSSTADEQTMKIPETYQTLKTHQPDEHLPPNRVVSVDQTSQTQDLSCTVCKTDQSSVKNTVCGSKLCTQCEKEHNLHCKSCSQASKQETVGIKGSVVFQESTVTIPGFIRDLTLKIIYDIPDGIQGVSRFIMLS